MRYMYEEDSGISQELRAPNMTAAKMLARGRLQDSLIGQLRVIGESGRQVDFPVTVTADVTPCGPDGRPVDSEREQVSFTWDDKDVDGE